MIYHVVIDNARIVFGVFGAALKTDAEKWADRFGTSHPLHVRSIDRMIADRPQCGDRIPAAQLKTPPA